MKLALVYHQFIRKGGLEGYLMEFTRRLHAAGHELELVCARADEEMRALAARVHEVAPAHSNNGTLRRVAEYSAALYPQLEVDAVLGFGRTWRQDIHRAGGGCHALYSRKLPWWKRWRMKNQRELALERRLYTGGETRHFVVNADMVGRELEQVYGVDTARISTIHTAVDAAHFRPAEDRAALRSQLGLRDRDRVLLFVSLDHRRKGLPALLDALRLLKNPELQLWVAGQRMEPVRDLSGIRELGNVSDLRQWYQAADLFLHPTQYDACANTVLQSMASGLPGLISVRDGAAGFIADGENGWLIDPDDAVALAEKIRAALPAAGGLAAAARATMQPLTWAAHLDAWMELIPQVQRR